MDTVRIRLYYDFASTLCYVSHKVLSSVSSNIEDLGVELEWRPIDLTAIVPWDRGDSFAEEVREAVHHTAREIGFEVVMPDPWLDSRPVAEVALATRSAADEVEWRHAVFRSIYESREPTFTAELLALAQSLTGYSPPVDDSPHFDLVEQCTREAAALGVAGVPALLLDDWLLGGVYDGETMVSILQQLAEQYRERGTSAVN